MMVVVVVLRPVIRLLNLAANGILRLIRVEPKDEVSSSYTREEVAALVEESRGEGMIAADEYDRLAGALGFTEKTVSTVLMPVEGLATVLRGSTGADVEALCATTGFSRFPVADPTAPCSATCTSRTCWRATRSAGSARWTTSGSARSPPSGPTTCSTRPSRACRPAGRTWHASYAATARCWAWSRSRTCSRSSSA